MEHGTVVEEGMCNVEDMVAGFLRLDNGCSVDFEFAWAANVTEERKFIEIFGEKGGAMLLGNDLRAMHRIG